MVVAHSKTGRKSIICWTRFPIMDSKRRLLTGSIDLSLWETRGKIDESGDFRFRGTTRPLDLRTPDNKCTIKIQVSFFYGPSDVKVRRSEKKLRLLLGKKKCCRLQFLSHMAN